MTKDQERHWTTRLIELRTKEAAIGSLPRKDRKLVERIRKLLHPECDKRTIWYDGCKFERYLNRKRWFSKNEKTSPILEEYRSKRVQRLERRKKNPVDAKPTPPPASAPMEVLTEKQFNARFERRSSWERFCDWLGDL